MKPEELKHLPKEPLTPAEQDLLRSRFRQKLRSFFSVLALMIILVLIEAGPMTAKINAAIRDQKLRWAIGGFALLLGGAVFYGRVWIWRRDLKAGFKYVSHMLVIAKSAGSTTVDLEDLAYHNLEVGQETHDGLRPGDRFAVGFAAHSGYPLTKALSGKR